jgi:hypothetical protein
MLTTSAIIMNQQVVLRLKCESVLHGLLYHWNIETSREIQFSFELKCISIAPGFRVRERAGRGRGTMSPSPRRRWPEDTAPNSFLQDAAGCSSASPRTSGRCRSASVRQSGRRKSASPSSRSLPGVCRRQACARVLSSARTRSYAVSPTGAIERTWGSNAAI